MPDGFLRPTPCPFLRPSPRPELLPRPKGECPAGSPVAGLGCGSLTTAGGPGVTTTVHGLGRTGGLVSIAYEMYTVPDRLDCYYDGTLVATTGGPVSGSATLTWTYAPAPGRPTHCTVVVTGPNGTAWQYLLGCPA